MSDSDTIAAIATAPGVGAIGIVRVSGPMAGTIAEDILGRPPRPRHAELTPVPDAAGRRIDQGLLLFFPAPGSFTGEDVLELQCHGGPVVLDLVLHGLLVRGPRLARPGEFSQRAFLNGRLDLAQAEAIADLIASATEAQARLAVRTLSGELSSRVHDIVERLTRTRTHLEATFDFPDEDIDPVDRDAIANAIVALVVDIQDLLASARQGELVRDGISIVIAGPPNAGKSSLMNALSGNDTAIVTSIPGTTRDLLRADLQLDGLPVRLVDTAGLRASDDPIETEGMRRARDAIGRADLLLWIEDDRIPRQTIAVDGSDGQVPGQHIRVRNKIDLTGRPASAPSDLVGQADRPAELAVSVRTGAGLLALRRQIQHGVGYQTGETGGDFSARRRHLDALRRGLGHVRAAADAATLTPDLMAEDLRLAQRALAEITGEVSSDDLLGRIFSEFCVGK